jgi:glycosyltransferase involved in cell wall biosynthesis
LRKVSTIIPVYNGEGTIAQAIDSALIQDCKDHEIVVVNDGSTDSTAAILEQYGGLIQIVTQSNAGLSAARNAGVHASTGKYIAFLDSDDAWVPEKLRIMVSALESTPSASLAFSECRLIDKDGLDCGNSSIGHPPTMNEIPMSDPFPVLPSTWVLSRQVFEKVGGFSEQFKGAQGFEDTWMLMLLREIGEFVYVPNRLVLYRVYDVVAEAKYGPGLSIFIRLLKQRYGRTARQWIRSTKHSQCRGLLSQVARQMNAGDRIGALRTCARIFCLWPTYFVRREFMTRLIAPQNTRRVRQLLSTCSTVHSSDASSERTRRY